VTPQLNRDFQNFNSHPHVFCTDGCFYGHGSFKACPTPQAKDLEEPFRPEVFKMLKTEGKIYDESSLIGGRAKLIYYYH
jgi:hypothetical protein